MKKAYKNTIFISWCIGICLIQGCSNITSEKGKSNDILSSKSTGNNVVKFDQKLAHIHNQQSAEDAVNHFVNYAISNQIDRTYKVKKDKNTQTLVSRKKEIFENDDIISSFASIEHSLRSSKQHQLNFKVNTLNQENKLISLNKLTSILNE
tara:strand:+ start:1390 stop:1842 length:453 start_codon:yes stop_codon:yes gene_type:complete